MEKTRFLSWCRGERVLPVSALLITGVDEGTEDADIAKVLNEIKVLGRTRIRGRQFDEGSEKLLILVECSEQLDAKSVPNEIGSEASGPWPVFITETVGMGSEVEEPNLFRDKLLVFLTQEGKSLEDLKSVAEPSMQPKQSVNVDILTALGQLVKDCVKPDHEVGHYRKLRVFSGQKPVPLGEEDYDTWMDQVTQMSEEWQCAENVKKQRVVESLRGPAADTIRFLRGAKPTATLPEYLAAIDNVFGTTESGTDLLLRFRSTLQEEGEKLSDFVYRLDKLMHRMLLKKIITRDGIDTLRMEQILRGALPHDIIAMKLKVTQSIRTTPSYPELMREIREEENRMEDRPKMKAKVTAVKPTTEATVGKGEFDDLKKELKGIASQVSQLLKVNTMANITQKVSADEVSTGSVTSPQRQQSVAAGVLKGAPVKREGLFCYRCGEDGHFSRDCQGEEDLRKVNRRLIQARKQSGNSTGAQ